MKFLGAITVACEAIQAYSTSIGFEANNVIFQSLHNNLYAMYNMYKNVYVLKLLTNAPSYRSFIEKQQKL